jgi:uncharacterized glyoxalase superfamily protein PhnB
LLKAHKMFTHFNDTSFAPELYIPNGVSDISFYKNAFGATENLCFTNDDGSIHVAELSINGAIFHVHEITSGEFFLRINIMDVPAALDCLCRMLILQ